ncbi:MocR-like pyridoxine biosynthesis transcription factor PdxR [Catelliglobosispora koreensis]|uniref:MocR-like pyridoxine biosynthesis transcription factor PdxR n=1 Tax=Catelliglobosispora koreensis TaxID=129052 RepID=UPI00037D52F7|nr:PLP-dependent aminotransferase family protein [Catelliglobosispora koreensis]
MEENWSTFRELLLPAKTGPRRLERALREAIRSGHLPAGVRLPSTRDLAAQLGLARGTVTAAYDQLIAEGYLAARRGSGTRVAHASVSASAAVAIPERPDRWDHDLRSGMPALGAFPRAAWISACRSGLDLLSDHDLGYPQAQGLAVLRQELAGYLARVRAMAVRPDDLVITHGSAEALVLLVRSLRDAGHTEIAVEDPSYPGQLELIVEHGLRPVPVRVDDEGLRVTDLERTNCRAVVVTSAHQYPLGVVLSPRRRRALVQWAEAADGLIIEDDYDAEHRYDRPAFGALQALSPERVAYLGTASKTLAPALRLGWLVLAGPRLEQVVESKRLYDRGGGVLEQAGFAELLRSGGYDRHLRKTRRLYRQRRDALLAELGARFPDWQPVGIAAGLHVVLRLPDGVNDREVAKRLADKGIRLAPLSAYAMTAAPYPGLVIGYGNVGADRLRAAAAAIAGALFKT